MAQNNTLRNRYHNALFRVRCSVRYHSHRQRYYENCHSIVLLVPILLSLTAVLILTVSGDAHSKVWLLAALPFISGVVTSTDAVKGFMQRAGSHKDFIRQFTDVEQRLLGLDWKDPESLTAVEQAIVEIEKSEPPIHHTLNLLCHNELVEAEGHDESEKAQITPLRRLLAQVSSR